MTTLKVMVSILLHIFKPGTSDFLKLFLCGYLYMCVYVCLSVCLSVCMYVRPRLLIMSGVIVILI